MQVFSSTFSFPITAESEQHRCSPQYPKVRDVALSVDLFWTRVALTECEYLLEPDVAVWIYSRSSGGHGSESLFYLCVTVSHPSPVTLLPLLQMITLSQRGHGVPAAAQHCVTAAHPTGRHCRHFAGKAAGDTSERVDCG